MIEQFKRTGELAWAGVSGGLAVNSLFGLFNLPDKIIDEVQKVALGNVSGESLVNLALTAYGLYSIKKTVKSIFGGGAPSIAITAGVISALIAGYWGNEKAAWAGPIGGAIASVAYTIIQGNPPVPLSKGQRILRQLHQG